MQKTVSTVENDGRKEHLDDQVEPGEIRPMDGGAGDRKASGDRFVYGSNERPLDGYTIKRGIGHGGFGEVYQAVSDAGKEVAIKLVRRNLDIELRGIRQCLNLKHPNLVSVYDIREDGHGDSWVIMDHVAGPSLDQAVADHPNGMPVDEALNWFRGVAAAVAYLHDHGIVHRDLKPANIFRDEGVVQVGDYGLSKFISCSRRSNQTESIGTVHYMAPEVANGRYGKEIDIYALGVMLYEMLTGALPFEGESIGEVLMKHLTAKPDLSRLVEPYRSVVARALEKDPANRYESVQQMVAALPKPDADGRFPNYVGPMPSPGPDAPRANASPNGGRPNGSPNGTGPYYHGPGGAPPPYPGVFRPRGPREEPLMRGLRRGWAALTTPLQVVGIILLVVLATAAWPLLFVLAFVYFVYYILWLLLSEATSGYDEANAELEAYLRQRQAQGGPAPNGMPQGPPPPRPVQPGNPFPPHVRPAPARRSPPSIRRVRPPSADEIAAAALQRKPFEKRATELLGSMLVSAMVCVLLGVGILVAECLSEPNMSMGPKQYAGYFWLTIVSVIGCWSILLPSKFWEGVQGDAVLRRLTMGLFGIGVALSAAMLSVVLMAELPHNNDFPQLVFGEMFERRGETLTPYMSWAVMAYYLAGFGLLFVGIRWWNLADPIRAKRFRVWPLIVIGLLSVLLADAIGFPQPWLPLAAIMIAFATQIGAVWISPKDRAVKTFD